MAVAVTFGHSWASAVFYNFSVIKLDDKDEGLAWDSLEYKKAWAERGKRDAVLSFDVHDDLCTILRKGKVERTVPTADIVSCMEDESCPKTLTIQFAPPQDPKKKKKFVEFERFECWNRFDRQIILELIDHAKGNNGSITDLEDSFPKQTIHHSVLQIRQKTSFDAKYCVLVKWKLYIYDDWYSKHTSASVCLMGVEVTKDPKDKKKLQIMTSPVPTYVRCNDEEERDFWYEMLLNSASMEMPSMEENVAEMGMDWDLFDDLMESIRANDEELDELEFSDPDWHLNEEQAFRLAEALMTPNTNVRRLDLSCNQMLGDDGTNAVSELLLDNLNCVGDLGLMGCSLHDHGLEMICAHLGNNTTCKTLDLAHNDITDSGIELLIGSLEENSTLKDLDVAGNQLTDAGFCALARELSKNTSLTRISMASMEPSDEGLCSLAEALKSNETLEELHLEDITITDGARAKLLEMLAANHKVTITGVQPPIERPPPPKPAEAAPEQESAPQPQPEAEPEPEPEPQPQLPKRKKRPPPEPMKFDAQGNLIRNFADPNLLHDGKLNGAQKGEGFMGMLNMWRDSEVIAERAEEMQQIDPSKRGELMKRFEDEDKKKGRARGTKSVPEEGVPPSSDGDPDQKASGGQTFGVQIEQLEMVETSEGQKVPKALLVLKEKIGDASTPQIFLKAADESAKASARAKLDEGSFENLGDDPHVAANLLLDWFGQYPGGVLSSLGVEVQQRMGDDEDGALKALEQLPEALQEAVTLLIDVANAAVINESNGVHIDDMAQRAADFFSPVPSKDEGQLFLYWLLVFWSENA